MASFPVLLLHAVLHNILMLFLQFLPQYLFQILGHVPCTLLCKDKSAYQIPIATVRQGLNKERFENLIPQFQYCCLTHK